MTFNNSFTTPVRELIRMRYSCRTYKRQPISAADVSALEAFSNECVTGPSGSSLRFKIVSSSVDDASSLKNLGTYGFIKDPAGFVIGTIQDQPRALEDFGYQMELIILRAAELGIGSCWLGGTYTKSRFAKVIKIANGETIPSVISIGYPADQQAWLDRISRTYAGADRRLPWSDLFYLNSFESPLLEAQACPYIEALEMVRLAPSASNKQPWRILRQDNQWHFYLQRTKNYPPPLIDLLLGFADLQRIDLGIAMAHFELTAHELGLSGKWEINEPEYPGALKGLEYNITWISSS